MYIYHILYNKLLCLDIVLGELELEEGVSELVGGDGCHEGPQRPLEKLGPSLEDNAQVELRQSGRLLGGADVHLDKGLQESVALQLQQPAASGS